MVDYVESVHTAHGATSRGHDVTWKRLILALGRFRVRTVVLIWTAISDSHARPGYIRWHDERTEGAAALPPTSLDWVVQLEVERSPAMPKVRVGVSSFATPLISTHHVRQTTSSTTTKAATAAATAKTKRVVSTVAPATEPAKKMTPSEAAASEAPTTKPGLSATPAPPSFEGKLRVVFAHISFFADTYAAHPISDPHARYAAVHAAIIGAPTTRSALCTLPSADGSTAGVFDCAGITDEMSDEQLDVALSGTTHKPALVFSAAQLPRLRGEGAAVVAPGIEVRMALDGDSGCFVQSSSGVLKLRRVWMDGDKELFEGFFEFTVNHTAMYARKGFDRKAQYSAGFWAVRL
jgi:hypothetical protein